MGQTRVIHKTEREEKEREGREKRERRQQGGSGEEMDLNCFKIFALFKEW